MKRKPTGTYNKKGNTYTPGTGGTLFKIHKETDECSKFGCTIHAPSNHPMIKFPTHWRDDRRMFERICECGVGHPDPDYISFIKRTKGEHEARMESVHGCCGCRCSDMVRKNKK